MSFPSLLGYILTSKGRYIAVLQSYSFKPTMEFTNSPVFGSLPVFLKLSIDIIWALSPSTFKVAVSTKTTVCSFWPISCHAANAPLAKDKTMAAIES